MESPKEKTYHAAAHAVAPGSWLLKVSFVFGSAVKITSKTGSEEVTG